MVARVILAGSTGKVGRELVKAILADPAFTLVGAVASDHVGEDAGLAAGTVEAGVKVRGTLGEALPDGPADLLIDFTSPRIAPAHYLAALRGGLRAVIGTTGIPAETLREGERICAEKGSAAAVIPNYSVGAMLLRRFCAEAARYLPRAHIIELHHETKLDKPSGTALALARAIDQAAGGAAEIASVRLPGMVAHHEVIFGGPGQALTLRHDSFSRESFVFGVLATARKVLTAPPGTVYYDLSEILG